MTKSGGASVRRKEEEWIAGFRPSRAGAPTRRCRLPPQRGGGGAASTARSGGRRGGAEKGGIEEERHAFGMLLEEVVVGVVPPNLCEGEGVEGGGVVIKQSKNADGNEHFEEGEAQLRPRCGRRMEFIAIGGCRGCPGGGRGFRRWPGTVRSGRTRWAGGGGGFLRVRWGGPPPPPPGGYRGRCAGARERGRGQLGGLRFAPPGGATPVECLDVAPALEFLQVRLKDGLALAHKADIGLPVGLRRHQAKGGERVGEAAREDGKGHARDGERDEGFNEGKGSAAGGHSGGAR